MKIAISFGIISAIYIALEKFTPFEEVCSYFEFAMISYAAIIYSSVSDMANAGRESIKNYVSAMQNRHQGINIHPNMGSGQRPEEN